MSPQRLVFFLSLGALSVIWSFVALNVSATRFEYRNMIEDIRAGDEPPSPEALAEAIASYTSTLKVAPCNAALHDDMGLLLGQGTDAAMNTEGADEDAHLKVMQDEIATQLSCAPTDGKAWLDFAMLDIYREGFTPRALAAYRMSAQVAPGESWLAEKRLLFALQFRELFDAKGFGVAQHDLVVLKRAHPNHLTDVMNVAQVKDEPALRAMFGAPTKAQ